MDQSQTREATPTNTVKINPITFDESALAEKLKLIVEGKPIEQPEPPKPEAKEEPPADQEAEQTPDVAPEEETEAPSQTESESEEQTEAEPTEPEPDEHRGVQKRIDKLVAKQKAAEEEAQRLKSELEDAKVQLQELKTKPSVRQDSSNPLNDITSAEELQNRYFEARKVRDWCEDHPDGAEIDGKEYSAEDIRRIKRDARDAIEVHIPQRLNFIQQFHQIQQEAVKVYPFWKDRSSPDYAEAMEYVNQMPELKTRVPGYQIIIGDLIEGRKAREARIQAAKAPKPAPKLPPKPQPGLPKVASKQADAKSEAVKKTQSQFMKTGSVSDLAELIKTF